MPPNCLMGCVIGPQSYCEGCGAGHGEGKGSFLQSLIPRMLLSGWACWQGLSPTTESPPRPNPLLISGLTGAQAMDRQTDIPYCTGLGRGGTAWLHSLRVSESSGPTRAPASPGCGCGQQPVAGSALDLNAM